MATYKGQQLGSIGDIGCYSFHETKNLISGEGGALLINNSSFIDRAEIIREKGTNRRQFFRGLVDKYTWVDLGSSYLPGEFTAAFLWAQMEDADSITSKRLQIWNLYHLAFEALETSNRIRRPIFSELCGHNAHMYYLLLSDLDDRTKFISTMKDYGVHCVFHYAPLHSSIFSKQSGFNDVSFPYKEYIRTNCRLPLWIGLEPFQEATINKIINLLQ